MTKKAYRSYRRSGNCLCDICGIETLLIEHHINGRIIHNANKKFNIANICSNCHDKVHMNMIIIEGWFLTSDGRKLLFNYT